ncbi:MAG: NADH:flavin oxidoreductase, partial [Geminicoccaceae bacterium]
MRDPRYDILFEPVQIGPVTARNRFYQVPHCNGMGYRDPSATAEMRRVKAEGGWAVVCTEQVEFHHTSDITPFIELRLWDDRDIPALAKMAEAIHEHGSLAGLELAYNGLNGPNLYGREVPMAPTGLPVATFNYDPVQVRTMDKQDIKNIRRWHKAAALRAKKAGFDLIYVYAGHALGFMHHFISKRYNQRTDEYGGSLENRVRIVKEILEDTKDAVGDSCAVPCRFSTDELLGPDGLEKAEAEDMIGMIAELPDLWDLCLAGWENDSQTSRFGEEGRQEPFIDGVKKLTSKPVVAVGRYTSADRMVSIIKKGIVDMIGAARPSIADPFLPKKIEEGRNEDIRECIGCNICVSSETIGGRFRCTQNPTAGE